jgi:type II secretory ATPase GspE/PulE/Tfp pilus assembly ATPase PilB-like protein
MLRLFVVFVLATLVWAVDAQPLLAAAADDQNWPTLGTQFNRTRGAYLSPWKILGTWLVFLSWVRTTDWISQDSQTLKLRWAIWNPIAFFSFFVGLLLLWILPWYSVGLTLLLVAYVAPLATYIVHRNSKVQSSYDKIFSNKHTRRWIARKFNAIGIKMAGADIDPRELGPDIKLSPAGGATDRDNNVNLLTARQSPGFIPSRVLLDDAISQRATHVMLDYTPESVNVRYQVDGVWHDRSAIERAEGDPVLEVLKRLAALKPEDRRSRQSGIFNIEAKKEKIECRITSQGTSTGERVLLQFEGKKLAFRTLEDIGMRAKTQEQLQALLEGNGLIVFASMPGSGLTTTMDVALSNTDRFIRNFVSVIDSDKSERDIENIHATTYSSSAGETPATVLPKLIRTYPEVIIVRDVADLDTLTLLCEQAGENRLVLTSIRAKEAAEALLRLMMLKIPPADFAPAVKAVLNVRLIRKLCETCKEAYPPPAEVLKQLGLPAGRIESLYRPPTQPIDPKHPDVVCEACQGIGYYGRTGIFELLMVDDTIRQVLTTAPKMENLRAAARKAKHRSLQEEGVLLVARGVTSIPELLRVLKQ